MADGVHHAPYQQAAARYGRGTLVLFLGCDKWILCGGNDRTV